ncbi:MAG: hypothetical protein RL450_456, partial [Actinomycetota bacterium]
PATKGVRQRTGKELPKCQTNSYSRKRGLNCAVGNAKEVTNGWKGRQVRVDGVRDQAHREGEHQDVDQKIFATQVVAGIYD